MGENLFLPKRIIIMKNQTHTKNYFDLEFKKVKDLIEIAFYKSQNSKSMWSFFAHSDKHTIKLVFCGYPVTVLSILSQQVTSKNKISPFKISVRLYDSVWIQQMVIFSEVEIFQPFDSLAYMGSVLDLV